MAHTGRPTQAHPVGPPAGWPSKDPCHVPRIVGLEVGALLRVCPCVHGAPLHAVAWPVTTMPPPQDSHFQAGSVTIVGCLPFFLFEAEGLLPATIGFLVNRSQHVDISVLHRPQKSGVNI